MTALAAIAEDTRPTSPLTHRPRHRLINYLRDLHEVWARAGSVSHPLASPRCARCGRYRISPVVSIRRRGVHTHFDGVMRCGLIWECPDCSAVVNAARAEEVEQVKAWHTARYGRDAALLVTLTVRHGFRDDAEALRRGVAAAWRRFISGQAWKHSSERFGLVGWVRKMEVTFGPSGIHPHLHVMMLFRRPPMGEVTCGCGFRYQRGVLSARRHRDRCAHADDAIVTYPEFTAWILGRWRHAVRLALGDDFLPDERHGVVVTGCADARYLARMGLELAAPETKAAKGGNRTPLDILAHFAATGDYEDAALYRSYARGMRGARQLTWSVGLRLAAGLTERTDEDIVAGSDDSDPTITRVAGADWDAIRLVPGALTTLLELAELHGAVAADGYIRDVLAAISDETRRRQASAAPEDAMSPLERCLHHTFDA